MIRWLFALLLTPSIAVADWHDQDRFPLLGSVVNVASDDTLNIRIEPDHTSEILGTIPHNAENIEIVAIDESDKWGLVNSGEASGWVRLSYITMPEQPKWHEFKTPMTCFGTEPFWDFRLNVGASQAIYTDYDSQDYPYVVDWMSDIAARPITSIGLGSGSASGGFSALIENQMCHDGMTDRENALRIRLYIHDNGESYGLDGCCGLSP